MYNPQMTPILQLFEKEHLDDPSAKLIAELNKQKELFKPGERIALAVGSRGVANIALFAKTCVEWLKDIGVNPFIVPAMGSHGGATGEGQKDMLASLGVTEEYTGAPVVSSMEVVELESCGLSVPVYMDKSAYEADGIVIINRIKPHTDFHGEYESGLVKMCVIGLGKKAQAEAVHHTGANGLRDLIPPVGRAVLESGHIRLGIGLVENAFDETRLIEAIRPEDIPLREKALLGFARKWMPELPLTDIDVLIVKRIGKEISGTCMDTNIIGRMRIGGEIEPPEPRIKRIIACELTEISHGNALGIGLADVTTKKLADSIDWTATRMNGLTSTFLERAMLPIVAENEAQAFEWALMTCGAESDDDAKIVYIDSTLDVANVWLSPGALMMLKGWSSIVVSGEKKELLDEERGVFRL